jgi:hypothetical protein
LTFVPFAAYSSDRASFETHLTTEAQAASSLPRIGKKERAQMLPFDKRPWAKQVAATVIVLTLVAAVLVPIYLHHRKALDPPIIVAIVLLLLAIIPPNIVILRRRINVGQDSGQRSPILMTRPANR